MCWVPGQSAYSFKIQEINVTAGETKDAEIVCFGSEIHPIIVEEYYEDNQIKRRPIDLNAGCGYYWCKRNVNTQIYLYQGDVFTNWAFGYNGNVFNVTPGVYTLRANVQYTAYPQPAVADPYTCTASSFYNGETNTCDTNYKTEYVDVDASKPGVYYAEIPFRTWMINDTQRQEVCANLPKLCPPSDCTSESTDPKCNPLGNFHIAIVGEFVASDFDPSAEFLIALALSLSLLLAFFQAKKPEPKGK